MTTRQGLRDLLRRVLEDTDAGSPLWSDAELNEFLATAVRQYSLACPKRQAVTVAFTVTGATYALPADVLGVEAVVFPASSEAGGPAGTGYAIPQRATGASVAGDGQSWFFDGANLVLAEGAGRAANAEVWCRVAYLLPGMDATDAGLPLQGDSCAVWGAAVLALTRRTIASGKRRQSQQSEIGALEAARATYMEFLRRARGAVSRTLAVIE